MISFEGGAILEDDGFSQSGSCERALTKLREPTTRLLWMQVRPSKGCAAVRYSLGTTYQAVRQAVSGCICDRGVYTCYITKPDTLSAE